MRLIDADNLELVRAHLIYENGKEGMGYTTVCFGSVIRNAPTIDAEPVRHGHWIVMDEGITRFQCSACGVKNHRTRWDYCTHCGAKMDGGNENAAD